MIIDTYDLQECIKDLYNLYKNKNLNFNNLNTILNKNNRKLILLIIILLILIILYLIIR